MAEKIGLNHDVRELKLGKSFDPDGKVAYHSLRYDFKPASVDTSKVASLELSERGSVEVTVPHVPGSGTTNTVYKGNKRPIQKECVLIIDHKTGEIKLEKLASTITLKKTRKEGSSKVGRPLTPTEQKLKEDKTTPNRRKDAAPHTSGAGSSQGSAPPSSQDAPQVADPLMSNSDMDISSSSASDSSDSEADSKPSPPMMTSQPPPPPMMTSQPPPPPIAARRPGFHSTLSEDLKLSDSGESDSD